MGGKPVGGDTGKNKYSSPHCPTSPLHTIATPVWLLRDPSTARQHLVSPFGKCPSQILLPTRTCISILQSPVQVPLPPWSPLNFNPLGSFLNFYCSNLLLSHTQDGVVLVNISMWLVLFPNLDSSLHTFLFSRVSSMTLITSRGWVSMCCLDNYV